MQQERAEQDLCAESQSSCRKPSTGLSSIQGQASVLRDTFQIRSGKETEALLMKGVHPLVPHSKNYLDMVDCKLYFPQISPN